MPDLSVLIPARNEEWLLNTVQDVLEHSKADTEVIVLLDGAWAEPGLPVHPKLHVVYLPQSIGQRAATNLGARLSTAMYICKLDAHCSVAEGWDVALIEAAQQLGPNVTQIPKQYRFHVYDQVCTVCEHRMDQAPARCACDQCGGALRKELVWQPRQGGSSSNWVFDGDLHFQYASDKKQTGDYPEVMSMLGACLFVNREHFLELGGFDEAHGSWGQYGQEWACKEWLSGGRVVCNRLTWYAHFFRVGGIGFPYDLPSSQQQHAQHYARDYWRNNRWPQQIHPLKWLVEKFWPIKGWTEAQRDALPDGLGRRVRDGEPVGLLDGGSAGDAGLDVPRSGHHRDSRVTAGCVYYTDHRLDPCLARAVREQLQRVALPVVSVSLKNRAPWPSAVKQMVFYAERGYLTMFQQILAGLEALETDVAFLCEHDVLYHPSHFDFVPPEMDRVYYNQHVWKVDASTGHALHYRCSQTSGLCASRQLLVEHYRRRVALVEARGFSRKMGFEPGTHRRAERVDDLVAETWMAAYPNVDIRHDTNLTPSRWRQDQFRDKRNCQGWTEADAVPGWGVTAGRFTEWLAGLSEQVAA